MSENLRTAKIPCYERVRKYRVHKIGIFSGKKILCPNIYGVGIFRVNTVCPFENFYCGNQVCLITPKLSEIFSCNLV